MKRLFVLAALISPLASEADMTPRIGYITFGPMLHWNFDGNGYQSFSYGLEAAYWSYEQDLYEEYEAWPNFSIPGLGLALGLETDWKALRVYAEPQVGKGYYGLSLGPVLELSLDDGPTRFGFQGDAWANYLLGMNFRFRRVEGKNNQTLGLYGKVFNRVSGKPVTE